MFEKEKEYVKDYLIKMNGDNSPREAETFRKRHLHMLNVYHWAQKIVAEIDKVTLKSINPHALYLAALFHDIGYGSEAYKNSHAIEGSDIWKEYAANNGYDSEMIEYVYYLIRNHSNKELLNESNTPVDLIILMEADWLDEEGAMSICWDSMAVARNNPQSYVECLNRIKKYSSHILKNNPMITKPARAFWEHKQVFVENFIKELEADLFIR